MSLYAHQRQVWQLLSQWEHAPEQTSTALHALWPQLNLPLRLLLQLNFQWPPLQPAAQAWYQFLPHLPAWLQTQKSLATFPEVILIWSARACHQAAQEIGSAPKVLELLETAARLLPQADYLSAFTQYAVATQQGERALGLLKALRQQAPSLLSSHLLYARVLVVLGRAQEALNALVPLQQEWAHEPTFGLSLGNVYQALGQNEQAQAAYETALAELPEEHLERAGLLLNLGWLQQQTLDFEAAERAYQQALKLDPQRFEAWNNLCSLKLEEGAFDEASAALQHCFSLNPEYAPAWVNRGVLLAQQGQQAQALEAFARARVLQPQLVAAWKEAAAVLLERRDAAAMQSLLKDGLESLPQAAELHWIYSRLLWLLHQPQAQQAGEKACQLAPQRRFWRFQLALGNAAAQCLQEAETQNQYLNQLTAISQQYAQTAFTSLEILHELRYLPELLWHLIYIQDQPCTELKRHFAACFDFSGLAQHLNLEAPSHLRAEANKESLRLGVVVTSGHEGIFLRLAAPLLCHLSAEIQVIWVGHAERLQQGYLELKTEQPTAQEPLILTLPGSLLPAADFLKSQAFDLLYYWEIGSDVLNAFLPYLRLAPVQFTSWGTPVTTGIPHLDYFVSSQHTEAEQAEQHYTEQLIMLKDLPHYCPDPRPQAALLSRHDFNLPVQGSLFVCLQNPLKYCENFVQLLARLLQADQAAQLLLLPSGEPWVQRQVEALLQRYVSKLDLARLHWLTLPLERAQFLGVLQLADVVLDTLMCSGGQTADEALLLGRPVVTLPGRSARNRLSYGRLSQMGVLATVAHNLEHYLQICLRLGQDQVFYREICDALEQRRMRLQSNAAAPKQWSEALWQMHRSRTPGSSEVC